MHLPERPPKKPDMAHEKIGERFSIYELLSRAAARGIPVEIIKYRKDNNHE